MKRTLLAALLLVPAAVRAESITEMLERLANRETKAPATVRGVSHRDHDDERRHGGHRRDDGREAAADACSRADFDHHKRECIAIVSRADYFNADAARACGEVDFSHHVPECMGAIANKEYLSAEVRTCGGSSFSHQVVECFRTGGRPYARRPRWERRPDLDSYILSRLRRVKRELDDGNTARALLYLAELLSFVEDGMNGRP